MSRRVKVHPHDGPMHDWFSLSYASYLVLHRSLIQEMPIKWQARLVALLDEMHETFEVERVASHFTVLVRGHNGRFLDDPLAAYRHADQGLIASLRRKRKRK